MNKIDHPAAVDGPVVSEGGRRPVHAVKRVKRRQLGAAAPAMVPAHWLACRPSNVLDARSRRCKKARPHGHFRVPFNLRNPIERRKRALPTYSFYAGFGSDCRPPKRARKNRFPPEAEDQVVDRLNRAWKAGRLSATRTDTDRSRLTRPSSSASSPGCVATRARTIRRPRPQRPLTAWIMHCTTMR
jgi:hypothetical protein